MKTSVILGDKIKLNSIELNRIKDHDNLASKKYVDDSMPNLSNFLTRDEFTDSVDTSNLVTKGSVATINGASIINGGNIEIDSSIYKIVSTLPTENINTEKLYLLKNTSTSTSTETKYDVWRYAGDEWINDGPFGSVKIDMSQYLSKTEADKRYMVKSSNANSSLIVLDNGQVNNLGNNGQAYNAIRDVTGASSGGVTNPYKLDTGSGYPINCAAFGIKVEGTAAFTHKKYDSYTYNKDTNTDKTTGAKNTAVMMFSGKSGLLYGKNTGTGADLTAAMYKRVGVIDSPDEAQRVYSVAQTDAQINTLIQTALSTIVNNFNDQINELKTRIEDLENQNEDLYTKVDLLIDKTGITEEELNGLVAGGRDARGMGMFPPVDMISMIQDETNDMLGNLPNDIKQAIEDVTEKDFENLDFDSSETDV